MNSARPPHLIHFTMLVCYLRLAQSSNTNWISYCLLTTVECLVKTATHAIACQWLYILPLQASESQTVTTLLRARDWLLQVSFGAHHCRSTAAQQ